MRNWKPFKNGEKCFLFHLKSFFCSQDILSFCRGFLVKTVWLERSGKLQNSWRHNLVYKQLRYPYCPVLQSKVNQTMKFGQLIEHNKRNNFLPKLFGKWDRETSSRPLFIFWKSLIWCESNWSAVYFRYISIALTLPYKKSKVYKTLDYWSRDLLNFNFSGNSFSTIFCVWFFQKKIFLMLYCINWPNLIAWLLLLLEILDNTCINNCFLTRLWRHKIWN